MQTWLVLLRSIQSLEQAAVVDLICLRSTKYSLQEFWDIKNNLWKQVFFFWSRNVPEIWVERTDQKHINNLPLAWQFALMAVKLQMFGGTLLEHVFLSRVHAEMQLVVNLFWDFECL